VSAPKPPFYCERELALLRVPAGFESFKRLPRHGNRIADGEVGDPVRLTAPVIAPSFQRTHNHRFGRRHT
jgi:hypothetical protein